jgi:DNA/RNA-binding domain of Phe-tRNA-synthetase-like protein
MPSLSIAEIADRFPDFRVALVVAEDLNIAPVRSAALIAEIGAAEAACRKRWNGTELSAIPGVAAWRSAYKGFGIKRTSYRSSVERLIKRVLAGGALP